MTAGPPSASAPETDSSGAAPAGGLLERLSELLSLIRFSHTVFALPFALLSAAIAWSLPDSEFRWQHLLGILLCMVFARSAAMAFNRIADSRIDADNPRTSKRHIPAGILSTRSVVLFTLLTSAGFVVSTLLFLPNRWPIYLSFPVLAFLLGYSFAKRFTSWCHYWLSAALMLSPTCAWIALRGEVNLIPVLLGAVIFFWVGGFDIIYACQDADFDREKKLFSIPAWLGIRKALHVARLSHLLTVVALSGFWHYAPLGNVTLAGVVGVAILLLYEHSLVRADDLTRVNIAFFNVNSVISIGLLVVGLVDLAIVRFS